MQPSCLGLRVCGVHDQASFQFLTLTIVTARTKPGFTPRGLERSSAATLEAWKKDSWAQAPYQYAPRNCVVDLRTGKQARRLTALESERLQGFPSHATAPVTQLPGPPHDHERRRKSLLGNAWHVHVAMFLLRALVGRAAAAPLEAPVPMEFQPTAVLQPPPYVAAALPALVWSDWTQLVARHAQIIQDMYDHCPYIVDRRSRGLPCGASLGAAPEDLFAASLMVAAGGVA